MAIIQSGSFVATGNAEILILRSDVDFIQVLNETEASDTNINAGVKYYWRRGTLDAGFYEFHPAADHTLAIDVLPLTTGFSLIDTSSQKPSAPEAVTAGTNALSPSYSTALTGDLVDGGIVRLYSTDQTDLNGLDFTVVTVVTDTSFDMTAALANVPGIAAGANGFWRLVAPDLATYQIFHPSNRFIADIFQSNPGYVETLVDHGLTDGQKVRFKVPASCGMTELDGLTATVTVWNDNAFDFDIDTTGFSLFTFPLPAAVPFTPAEVIPLGNEPSLHGGFADALRNGSFIGIRLATGAASPAGSFGDIISWVAGKSDNL